MTIRINASAPTSLIAYFPIDSLILYGGKHSMRFGFYRMVATRFPYLVFYKIDVDTVIVFRILPGRRDPKWIRAALRIPGKKK